MIFPMLSQGESILGLIKEYWPQIDRESIAPLVSEKGGIDPLDGLLLHCIILKCKPRHIIEFSPNVGYSTKWISLALRTIGQKKSFWTFEINPHILQKLTKNLQHLSDYVTIVEGNALATIPETISREVLTVDLCFIDSAHGLRFTNNYINTIFPLLSRDCIISIHDICAGGDSFKSSLHDKADEHSGEYKAIKQFLIDRKIQYSVLHAITGGRHEDASLPINKRFYNELEAITEINFISQFICPKTLWFKL